MATWNGVITNAGNSLLNEWVNEKTLNFDSAAAGQGTVAAAAMMAQTALVNEKQTASLLGGERVSSGIRLKLRIAAPNTAYTLNQFRVSASVGGGASAMIALFQLEQGVPIPSKTESPDFVYTFYALISCSNTGTWTVTVDTSACVTQGDMSAAIAEAVKTKQNKIMVKGLLLGDGNGNISAAVAGKDYGYPLATGSGAPTDTTEGTAGQHYYDSATGKEYVCSGKDSSGKYQWKLSGASDAADLTYNGESLDTFLDGVSSDLDTLSKGLDGSKPLTGKTDPTSSTKGSVGQSYLNTDTMQTFYCTAANDQTGVYTWEKPKGGGVAPQLEVSVATGSAITCTNGETTLTGTSVGGKCVFDLPGYGTWSLYATLNGQTTATETVVVDQVKQYAVTLSYFAATLTVTAESGAVVTATLGTKQYTGTCGSNGKCALTVNYAGTYSVTATKSGVSSSTASAEVSTSGGSYTATVKFCTLTVTIDSGSTVKAVNGSTTLTATRNGKVLPAEHRHVERHRHQERRDGHRQRSLQLLHRLYAGAVLCQGLRCLLELQCTVDGADPLEKVHRSERTGQCRHHHESRACGRYRRRQLPLRQLSPVERHGRVQHHQQCRKLQEGAERLLSKQLRYRRLYPRVLLPYYRRCRQQETVLLHRG